MLPSLSGLSLSVVDTEAKRDRDELDDEEELDDGNIKFQRITEPDFESLPRDLIEIIVKLFVSGSANIIDVCRAVANWCATSKSACDYETWSYVAKELLKIETEPVDGNWNAFIGKHCSFLKTTEEYIRPASYIRERFAYSWSHEGEFKKYEKQLNDFLFANPDGDVDKYKLAWRRVLKTFPDMIRYTSLKNDEEFVIWYLNTVDKVQPRKMFWPFYRDLIPGELKTNLNVAKRYMLRHPVVFVFLLGNFPGMIEKHLVPYEDDPGFKTLFMETADNRERFWINFTRSPKGPYGLLSLNATVVDIKSGAKTKEYNYSIGTSHFPNLGEVKFYEGESGAEYLVKVKLEEGGETITQHLKGTKGNEIVVQIIETDKFDAEIATIARDFERMEKVTTYRDGRRTVELIPQPEPMDTSARLDRLDPESRYGRTWTFGAFLVRIGELGTMSRTWRESATELAVWWSVWTLADTYLISYTPFSELSVLVIVLIALYWRAVWESVSKRYAEHSQHLQVAIDRI